MPPRKLKQAGRSAVPAVQASSFPALIIEPGTQLGPYEIVEPLGAGGMGEVYVAEDTRLDRKVALKVLAPELASDPERRARFEREAKAVATLNHPNIVVLHSIEEAKLGDAAAEPAEAARSLHFLTMELVEGETLSEVIPRNGLPLDDFFHLTIPLLDAVAAAHERGIVHRDLKPANVMVGPEGRVKVLDFGLAKMRLDYVEASGMTSLSTALESREGKILGTLAYMSPEQAEGKAVDDRTDIFSLGVLLYEMVTGRRPFTGESQAAILSSILGESPESVTALRPELPRHLGRIVKAALQKDRERRIQTVKDLRNQLTELQEEMESGEDLAPAVDAAPRLEERVTWLEQRPSLAVVPFDNLSDDPEQDYFAKGLWADINADLVKISGLFLISQTTTRLYADKDVTPQEVGRELGVRHVLVGTVRKAGDRVRITVELVDTRTAEPIWADRFDGKLDDLFALQDQCTEEIVKALDVELVHGEVSRVVRRSMKSPKARDVFYRALPLTFSDQREDLYEAQRLLVEAAGLEPESPVPPSMAAWCHYWEVRLGLSDSPRASLDEATALADEAIELDDPSGMAYMLKGAVYLMHREHDRALEASDKALGHRPSCPWAFALKGSIYNYLGKPDQAVGLARQAMRLTPLFPPLFPAVLAAAHYLSGQAEEAADAARRASELAPDNLETHVVLAAALAASGCADEAGAAREQIRRIKKDFSIDEFLSDQPFRDAAVLDRLAADLEGAGLG